MSFPAIFPLADLNGYNGFVINGIDPNDQSGHSVSGLGDINGDGFDDIIIGAPYFNPLVEDEPGEAYVVFGSGQGFNPSFNLSNLNGSNGFVIQGLDPGDDLGESVSGAGDINGDGFDDIIIGAPWADQDGPVGAHGEAHIIFGSNQGFSPSFDLSGLNGSNGFVFNGIDDVNFAGNSVSSAGDINGDGLDDILISAPYGERLGGGFLDNIFKLGHTYVVFGRQQGFASSLDISSLNGSNGFTIFGTYHTELFGSSVSSAGDINGDGFDDILIGAEISDPDGKTNAGRTYVVFGKAGGFNSTFELSSLDGSNGFAINGIAEQDYSGGSVSSAGDINGDGFDDILIGAWNSDPNDKNSAGQAYVVFGSDQGFSSQLELSGLNGNNGFAINGEDALDVAGWSVSTAGDVNGDGFDDILVGARLADPTGEKPLGGLPAGATYVVYGTSQGFSPSLDLGSITNGDGSKGFVIDGIGSGDQQDMSVSAAGDVNGDGFDDILIGADHTNSNGNFEAGATYVVFGRATVPAEPQQDFNNDGNADLLWRNSISGEAVTWYMNGSTYASSGSLGTVPTDWDLVGSADLNNDGHSDLLWRNSLSGEAVTWYMNGSTYAGSDSLGTVPTDWQLVGTSDFNNDGSSDLLWRNSISGEAVTWYMNGSTYAASSSLGTVPTDWKLVGAADFNNDGSSDLLWHNSLSGEAVTWYMNGSTYAGSDSFGTVSTDWELVGSSDLNNDGHSDLLWRNSLSGEAVTWYMNGSTYAGSGYLGTVPNDWQLVG